MRHMLQTLITNHQDKSKCGYVIGARSCRTGLVSDFASCRLVPSAGKVDDVPPSGTRDMHEAVLCTLTRKYVWDSKVDNHLDHADGGRKKMQSQHFQRLRRASTEVRDAISEDKEGGRAFA
jgi:hypothetical protein